MSNPHFEKCKFFAHRGEPRKKGAFFRMPLFLHKVGKNRRADDRKKARHDDGQAAHRALDLADLERLGRAQRVRGRANAHALGDGVVMRKSLHTETAITLPKMPVMMIMATVSVT